MEKLNHICTWDIEIYQGIKEIITFPNVELPGTVLEFLAKGVCRICKREITKEELEWRANVGEREYARQATYVKRED